MAKQSVLSLICILSLASCGSDSSDNFAGNPPTKLPGEQMPDSTPDGTPIDQIKVAFVGDQGTNNNARAVLSMIANENADLVLIQGDLGYDANTAADWEQNLNDTLGADFPILAIVGNHENFEWPIYKTYIENRVAKDNGLSCIGDIGVKAVCQFQSIDIVQTAPGVKEVIGVKPDDNYGQFIEQSFADSTAKWRICSWHKNQRMMQTGKKTDETGWGVYNACLDAGAIVATGHEHAYSRTYLMTDFETQSVAHTDDTLTIEPGYSFAFVSGLGGRGIRDQVRSGDWWASIYTESQEATHGALFCNFVGDEADCYFKAIDGAVPDSFTLTSGH